MMGCDVTHEQLYSPVTANEKPLLQPQQHRSRLRLDRDVSTLSYDQAFLVSGKTERECSAGV
jgi:hypothetical protein